MSEPTTDQVRAIAAHLPVARVEDVEWACRRLARVGVPSDRWEPMLSGLMASGPFWPVAVQAAVDLIKEQQP